MMTSFLYPAAMRALTRGSSSCVSLGLRCGAFYHHPHSVCLDYGDWCLRGNEFAFGDNIDDVIGEAGFAARSQNRDGGALRSGREREGSSELSWHAS